MPGSVPLWHGANVYPLTPSPAASARPPCIQTLTVRCTFHSSTSSESRMVTAFRRLGHQKFIQIRNAMTMTLVICAGVIQPMSERWLHGCCWQLLVTIMSPIAADAAAGEGISIFIASYWRDYCRESIHYGNVANIGLSLMFVWVCVLVQYSLRYLLVLVGIYQTQKISDSDFCRLSIPLFRPSCVVWCKTIWMFECLGIFWILNSCGYVLFGHHDDRLNDL